MAAAGTAAPLESVIVPVISAVGVCARSVGMSEIAAPNRNRQRKDRASLAISDPLIAEQDYRMAVLDLPERAHT